MSQDSSSDNINYEKYKNKKIKNDKKSRKKNSYSKSSDKNEDKSNSDSDSLSYKNYDYFSNQNENKENNFSSDEENNLSSNSVEGKERIKSIIYNKDKKIVQDLKETEMNSSDSNTEKEAHPKNTENGLETKERKEDNITINTKTIREKKKLDIKLLIPKNQSGKFLMDEKNTNKDNSKNISEIIDKSMDLKNTDSIIKSYISDFKSDDKKKFFKNQGFILTDKSMERMALLIHYILNGIPVLFEGNTGTSKTRTTLTACKFIKKFIKKDENRIDLIRYNLSAETRIDDIISKYISDSKSIIGLKVKNGPFVDAYENGKILLFDEINLAPSNVLQCIQQSLDNDFLSVETNGKCLLKYKRHPNFALVATQNPNKGAYAGKRQELGPEFLSRFQRIYFPDILEEEMQEIALGIAENVGYINKNDKDEEFKKLLIKDIVKLHYEWAKETESQADIQCFTIREIESVIECLSNKENIYDVIMTIYGGRFRQDKKNLLISKLTKFEQLKELNEGPKQLPKDFPKCFKNDSLIATTKSVLLALRNKRNVIIIGNNESGLTQVAEWCSSYFNQTLEDTTKEKFICYCTKNLECSDLIGTQKISDSSDNNNPELIKFEKGFLFNAIAKGHCVVLDSINEAPSRVIERLNGLLDKKNNKKEAYFEVPENTQDSRIKINRNFRIICTSNFDKINQISPAFVNRFEVIVLEDQLKSLKENEMKNLILFLCKKYQNEYYYNSKKRKKKFAENNNTRTKLDNNDDDPFEGLNMNENKNNLNIKKKIDLSEDIIDLILEKITILLKGRNPNESNDDIICSNPSSEKIDENSKKYLTMSSINKFCRTLVILKNKFEKNTEVKMKAIINFSFELLFEEELSSQNRQILDILGEELIVSSHKVKDLGNEQYFFDKSESLKKFMVQIYACSLVNQYLCIVGPPGIGKTIGARTFSYIREIIFGINSESPFYMHTFNQFTRPSDYFGISTLKDEKLFFRESTLTKSIREGKVFIADEFNISSEDCMKAITPILELKFGEKIIIPGIENKISIDPDFFFIICQNTRNTFGRKDLPEKIKVKIKVINYPNRVKEEIKNICESIYLKLFKGRERANKKMNKEQARLCGDFMMALNEKEILTPWSLRDISKLFERINKQSLSNPQNYKNLNVIENILFYILSSTNESLINERLKIVVDLITKIFRLNPTEKKILTELYFSTPLIKKKDDKIYIEKGDISIFYRYFDEKIYKKLEGLPSVLNALFKILITSDDEPILISGPSSFKTFLAKLIFYNIW